MTEAEFEVLQLPACENQGLPAATRTQGEEMKDPPPPPQVSGAWRCHTSTSGSGLQNCVTMSVALGHPVCAFVKAAPGDQYPPRRSRASCWHRGPGAVQGGRCGPWVCVWGVLPGEEVQVLSLCGDSTAHLFREEILTGFQKGVLGRGWVLVGTPPGILSWALKESPSCLGVGAGTFLFASRLQALR